MSKFVYDTTIQNNVPGALSNPGQSVVCKVGKHKVLVSRKEKLDRYGIRKIITNVIRNVTTILIIEIMSHKEII